MAKIQSVEPNVADLANGWLKSYKLDYKLEQESLNTEIDQALNDYYSKNGGVGGNRPDAKLLLQDKNLGNYPILIEYKGYKDKLVKLDVDGKVANKTSKNQPDFKNINSYAVNGAVHYANALLHYTSYTDIIAIGMTGYKNDAGKLEYEIGVYYVSKSNFGIGQKVDEYTDFSFLKKSNFDGFIEKVKRLQLSQEDIEKLREHREQEINASLVKLNNDIYNNEKALSMMSKGYAAIIIQNSAGSGKSTEYNKRILKHSTLLASVKMPIDLFIGKSSVQTNVYVFRVGEAHQKDDTVKFIDFSVDGYTRTNRKKASCNLRDTDHAKERYQELVDLVRFGKSKLNIFTEKEYYEGKIDPNNGADWNQTAPIDTKPTLDDFKKTVSDYLAWEVSNLLKNQSTEDDRLGK